MNIMNYTVFYIPWETCSWIREIKQGACDRPLSRLEGGEGAHYVGTCRKSALESVNRWWEDPKWETCMCPWTSVARAAQSTGKRTVKRGSDDTEPCRP